MPSAETRIRTGKAATYLVRLCGHLAKLASPRPLPRHRPHLHADGEPPTVLRAEHTSDAGTVMMTWGQLTLRATMDELTIRASADSPEHLLRIQDMTADRLSKYGRREQLNINWIPSQGDARG